MEEMIRATQQSGSASATPVLYEPGVNVRRSFSGFDKTESDLRRCHGRPVDGTLKMGNVDSRQHVRKHLRPQNITLRHEEAAAKPSKQPQRFCFQPEIFLEVL
jgi:hypothetical protein